MDFTIAKNWWVYILSHQVETGFVILLSIVIFVYIKNRIKPHYKKVDYNDAMHNGQSFDVVFDFNSSIASEKGKYEQRLEQIDQELSGIKLELKKLEDEYSKIGAEYQRRKDIILHHERQLVLQYNTFIKNLDNLNMMVKEHEKAEARG